MFAVPIGFSILWLALAMWVYFDATERGKAGILWALLVYAFGWTVVPFILYAIFRDQGHRWGVPAGSGKRLYLYIVSFAGAGTIIIGLSLLLGAGIWRGVTDDRFIGDSYRELLAGGLTATIVGVIAWATHWFRARRRLSSIADDQEFRVTFFLHRSYLYTLIGVSWVIVFIVSLWFFGGLMTDLFGVGDVDVEAWVPALAPLFVSLVVIAYHVFMELKNPVHGQLQSRFEGIPGPTYILPSGQLGVETLPSAGGVSPTAPPPSPTPQPQGTGQRFCGQCGSGLHSDDAFCRSCGVRLSAV